MASPIQTVIGKGLSNPLKAEGLPKILKVLWSIISNGMRNHNKDKDKNQFH